MNKIKLASGAVLLAAAITIGYMGASGQLFTPKSVSASDPASGSDSVKETPPATTPPTNLAPEESDAAVSEEPAVTPTPGNGSSHSTSPAGSTNSGTNAGKGTSTDTGTKTPPAVSNSDEAQALETLNSFYKPALKGQFPGAVAGLTLGVSTRQDVKDAIGEPESPGEDADAFDVYHATMGSPGYAISYKLNKIREMRYFGTNVERQTNIGGITLEMLKEHWGKPASTSTIKNGKLVQTKVVYTRGDYALSFIFNDAADLDHINLTAK